MKIVLYIFVTYVTTVTVITNNLNQKGQKMVTVQVAYGRNLKSKKQVQEHYDLNKDFQISDLSNPHKGSYINKSDAEKMGVTLKIRYRYNLNTMIIKPKINDR